MRWMIAMAAALLVMASSQPRAQEAGEASSVFSDYLNVGSTGGFIHVPGLGFNSSMGFSYMTSDGYRSVGMGYYMGHFSLRLRPSLTLRWDVGIRSIFSEQDAEQRPELFFPNIDLTYRPSDKLFFRIEYSQYPNPASLRYWR
jgi:hypothetical protein